MISSRFLLLSMLVCASSLQAAPAKPKTSVKPKAKTQVTVHKKAEAKAELPKPTKWEPFRLIIPAIGLDIPIVQGADNDALKKGPGHDSFTPLPGKPGNSVIAAHRNIHGAHFWYLNEIKAGSVITVQTARETLLYKVAWTRVVPESQTDLLEPELPEGAAPRLTLYTCTLPVSPKRVITVANLIDRQSASKEPLNRPTVVRDIVSGPLHLLKDRTLRAQLASKWKQKKIQVAPLKSS